MQKDLNHLLSTKRFLPLFLTQFFGAFNDNVFKNSLVILITYYIAQKAHLNPQIMVTLAAGLFILPFFILSATAGQLADKFEKSILIRYIKIAEIIFMATAALGFYLENVYFLLAVLFCMGAQSTFFGPLKYSILPDHLKEDELVAGNGIIEAGTFLAILLGTIFGGVLILKEGGVAIISAIIIMIAIIGYLSSRYIPDAPPADPQIKINWNIFSETWNIIKCALVNKDVFYSILGISWFWFVGATFLAQFPTYAKDIIGGNEEIVTLFLTIFSIGIGLGSLLCNKLLKGEVNATFVPVGTLGISIFTIDLYLAGSNIILSGYEIGVSDFFATFNSWRIAADLLLISICSGIYIVPLYAIMQSRSEKSHRARIIASNNVINALFMVLSAVGCLILLSIGFTVNDIFLTMAIINFGMIFIIKKIIKKRRQAKGETNA